MSKYKDRPYHVSGHSSWEQFWSQNNPDGKEPQQGKAPGKYPPKKPRHQYKQELLDILEGLNRKTPVMDFDDTRAKLAKDIEDSKP